jgi:hypothetical protein
LRFREIGWVSSIAFFEVDLRRAAIGQNETSNAEWTNVDRLFYHFFHYTVVGMSSASDFLDQMAWLPGKVKIKFIGARSFNPWVNRFFNFLQSFTLKTLKRVRCSCRCLDIHGDLGFRLLVHGEQDNLMKGVNRTRDTL